MGLTVFAEAGCSGASKEINDSEVNLAKVGVKFGVKSAIVDGNPWILFTEERYQGFLTYLEEGRYEDLLTLGLPANYKVASVKFKKESLANPQIRLYNASTFADSTAESWWSDPDLKVKWIDASLAGVWAIRIDQTVLYREGTGHGSSGSGTGWTAITGGKMRGLSVGGQAVWAINPADEVFVRVGLAKDDTKGKEWTKIDGSMKTVSVGPTDVCWAVDKQDTVWRRLGANSSNSIGSKWQSVTGRLSHITVGQAGVWGISPKNEVMYRDQTYGLPGDAEGSGWSKVDGMMVWLRSGENIVWGVSANGELWYRAGIEQHCPMGTNWFKMNTGEEKNREWKLVAGENGCLWGLESPDIVTCKKGATLPDILAGDSVTLADEYGQFKSFSIQEKPSSYLIINGGWVIYEKPNFKGKCLYNYDGDCYSNDPECKKGPKLKMWQDQVGSIRFLRGLDCKPITVEIEMDWNNVETEHLTRVVSTEEEKNTTFDFITPKWTTISQVEALVSHKLTLSEPVQGISGCNFNIEGVPKAGFTFTKNGNKLETGLDFRQELSNMFTFHNEVDTSRERKKMEVVRLPPCVAPKTEVKVSIVIHRGIIKMPFKAKFTSGNAQWDMAGLYSGEDATQIKLEFAEVSLLEGNRKVSRM